MTKVQTRKILNLVRIKHHIPMQIAQPDPILQRSERTILRLIPD